MRIPILAFFLLLFQQSYGQYVSSWYNMDNGLPQNSVKDIIKDKYGFIWLSTDGGIVRYDGLSFNTYNKLPLTNFHFGNFFGDAHKDSIIIYNNNEEGQVLIKKRTPHIITKQHFERTFTSEKNIFLKKITKNEIDTKYYPNTKYFIKTISGEYIFHYKGLIYKDKKEKTKTEINIPVLDGYNVFLHNEILFITDPENRKTYRIYKGEMKVFTAPTILNDPNTKIYWQQLTGQTFIINNNNIYLLQEYKKQLQLKFLLIYENFAHQFFNSLFYDKDFRRLYLGSFTKGLNVLQLTQFYTAQKKVPFVDDVSNSSLPFSKNTVIDPLGYEVSKYRLVKDHHFGFNVKHFMFYDHSGNILYQHTNAVIRRYKHTGYTTTDTISIPGLRAFYKSSDLYAAFTTHAKQCYLHIFQNESLKKIQYTFRFTGFINSFLKHNNDEIFIGCSNGLYMVSLQKRKVTLILRGINVKNVFRTSDGQIWVTTNKDGFYMVKDKKPVKMPLDHNSYLNSAHYIVGDQYGYYWISSNNGLFRVPKKHLSDYASDPKKQVFYYLFTKSDGLLTNEFNGGSMPDGYALENGDFVFPSMEGFVFFDPKNIQTYYPDRKNIYIERARINNTDIIHFKNHLILENNYKNADVYIDIPYYSSSYNLRIEAKIEGENSGWERIDIKNDRKYTISGLGPGNYILKLRVQVSASGSYEYRTLSFEIKPLFYQTTIFKMAAVFLLLLILIGIIHTRTKFLHIRNKALKKTVSNISIELQETSQHLKTVENDMQKETEYQKKLIEAISHDISTPVKFIAMLSQKLTDVHEIDHQKEYFDSIHQSSKQLYNFTIHLKEYSDLFRDRNIIEKEKYDINEIFLTKKKLFQEIAKEKNNRIEIDRKKEIYCNINQNIMACIIHNLIDNAVKYTSHGIISLKAEHGETGMTIKISDTGNGMMPEQVAYYNELYQISDDHEMIRFKNYGLGLHMVIYLIKKIKAEITFCENHPAGTVIEIHIKKYDNE